MQERGASRARVALTALPALMVLFTIGAQGATLEVDDTGNAPFATIQSALDAAVPGVDDVFVHCGLYPENLVLRDGVSVAGAGPLCTVIDGGGVDSTVTMIDVGAGTVFEGFTVRNGLNPFGGGIYIESSSATVRGNVVENNRAVDLGGGEGNGGGIYVSGPITVLQLATAPLIEGNVIRWNSADGFGGGIEISEDDGSTVRGNIVFENTALLAGGGIDVYQSFPLLSHNTVVRNCLQSSGSACASGGGGIALTNSGAMDVANNAVAFNEAATGGGGIDVIGTTVAFTGNDVFGNTPADYAGLRDPTGSNGNISADPLFVDLAAGDLQPRSDSQLVDSADAGFPSTTDVRGLPRPLDGDADGTAVSDIGARENEGVTRLRFDGGTTQLVWDPCVDPLALYNLYRGELQVLRDTGVYTQDPGTVPGADRQCALGSPAATDTSDPGTGEGWYYLAVVDNVLEGGLGYDSALTERPFTNPNRCP